MNSYEEIYKEAFEDELQKIAEGYKDPGGLRGVGGAVKAYYTDKPLQNMGTVAKEQLKGLGAGAIGGGAAGAAGGAATSIASKILKKTKKFVPKKMALPAAIGAAAGGLIGSMAGGKKGFENVMAKKGIKVKGYYSRLIPKYGFNPGAAKKYNVKMDKAKPM